MSSKQRRRRVAGRRRGLSPLVAVLVLLSAIAWAGTLGVVAAGAGAAGASPGVAAVGAGAAAAPARLIVDAGAAGIFIPGRPLAVRVQVDGDRLIRGQLVVSAGAAQLAEPVEIAGGSSKKFELVVPTAAGQSPLSLQVSLSEQRTRLASTTVSVSAAPDVEVIGLVPALLAGQPLPSPVPLSIDAGTARFVEVTEQDLALAPASLGPLSAVALGPDDLGRMGSATRQGLTAWTAGGGRLLIDARPGDPVTGLPAGWLPSGSGPATAGRGDVLLTGGAMAAGKWAGLIRPASHTGTFSMLGFNGMAEPLTSSLAGDAGLRTPRLPWLVLFLVLYIAVVGPVAFLLLRRLGRAEWLWAVIPVAAVIFAATGYAVGAGSRSGVRIVHATIVDTTAGGGNAVSYVAVVSRGEATTRFDAPAGWVLQRYPDTGGPQPGSGPGLTTTVVRDGVEGRLSMSAGQFAVVSASGPAHLSGQLSVTARSTSDGHAEGTVTNNTGWSLQDVSVLIGTAGTDVGTLAPGAKADWVVTAGASGNAGNLVEWQLWGPTSSSSGFGGGWVGVAGPQGFIGPAGRFIGGVPGSSSSADNRPVSQSVWGSAPSGLAPGTRGNGVAVAVGWTDQARSSVAVGGQGPVGRGRTAVVGSSPVDAGAAGVGDLAMRRRVLRGDLTQIGPPMFADSSNSGQATLLGWTVPPAAAGHQLTLSIPANTGRIEVWGPQGWRIVTEGSVDATGQKFPVPFGPVPFVTPPVGPGPVPTTTAVPATTAVRATTAVPAATAVPATAPPQPVPQTIATPPSFQTPNGVAAPTPFTLAVDDVHDGAVYVRIAGTGAGSSRPFDLNALALRVAA